MNGEQFEQAVASWLQREGFRAELTPRTNDRGIDILATKHRENYAIQAKAYSADNRVGSSTVQKASGLLSRPDIDYVMVVTTSSFTSEAKKVAKNRGVQLITDNNGRLSTPNYQRRQRSPSANRQVPSEINNGKQLNIEIFGSSEKQLVELYRNYMERFHEDVDKGHSHRTLSFEFDRNDSDSDEYNLILGQHSIVHKSESVKLGNRFLKTVEEYGWEILYTKKGYSDEKETREHTPPDLFSAIISTNSGRELLPKRQATISKLILGSIYDKNLKGIVVTDSGPSPQQENYSTVLGET